MAISSINTNQAALLAQQNIGVATQATNNDVSALSSGSRLVNASTDVAALAIGSSLQSQVNILNTSLQVASQGSSLLQVADGGLSQIQSILQRQQAITTEAQAGSLSSTQLGFLNEEFQNLTQEIDQLAGSTNFNGVNLINGAISGNANITTNVGDNATSAATAGVFVTFANAAPANGDTITINGVKVTFTTATAGTSTAAGDVTVGDTAADTAGNLAAFLNQSGDPQFAGLYFSANNSNGTVSATYTGGKLANSLSAITVSENVTTSANVSISNITVAAGGGDGLGVDTTTFNGQVTGSLLVNGDLTAQGNGQPIDVSTIKNNSAFIGNFASLGSSLKATYNQGTPGSVGFQITVGNFTYTAPATQLYSSGAVVALTFTGVDNRTNAAGGGTFKLNINGSALGAAANVSSQADANGIAAQLNSALSGVTFYQNSTLTSFQKGNIVSVGGVQVGNLSGSKVDLHLSNFNNANISSFNINAPTAGTSDATITAVINGETYTSLSGIGNKIATNTQIILQDTSNPNNTLEFVTGNTGIGGGSSSTALDLSSQNNATAIASAIQSALGLNSSNASLTFQVGSASADTIGVSIGSATSSALFGGQSLDVLTQSGAVTAGNAVQTALNTVSSLRASVGALEERFNFASSAIQSAVQNEGAAKSSLLDTDVASTSTAFATAQVQDQAGIAVLAQANQLVQNLLKLIA